MKTLKEWLIYCENLHSKDISLGLERVKEIAKRLDLKFNCQIITVAGTNGKGSTCAMLESIVNQAGYRTGVYTSPHLVNFEERCRINLENVLEKDLINNFEIIEKIRLHSPVINLTYFEFTTLVVLHLLSKLNLDLIILEVGLGGRLDATNIIDSDIAIITNIDIDHTKFLGKTKEEIGFEKAGIMRANKPIIFSDKNPPKSVINYASKIQANLFYLDNNFRFSNDNKQWSWQGKNKQYFGLNYPNLFGLNQLKNASGVLMALECLNSQLPITAQDIRNGLSSVKLNGRFQIINQQPMTILDVAHNPHSADALVKNLDNQGFYPKNYAIFGAMADKDLSEIIKKINPLIDEWHFTNLPIERAIKAENLQQLTFNINQNIQSSIYNNPNLALESILKLANPEDRIIVFGSFYTVGEILKKK